jgi:hypothetical protein
MGPVLTQRKAWAKLGKSGSAKRDPRSKQTLFGNREPGPAVNGRGGRTSAPMMLAKDRMAEGGGLTALPREGRA